MPTTPLTRNRDSPDIALFAPGTRHNPGVGITRPRTPCDRSVSDAIGSLVTRSPVSTPRLTFIVSSRPVRRQGLNPIIICAGSSPISPQRRPWKTSRPYYPTPWPPIPRCPALRRGADIITSPRRRGETIPILIVKELLPLRLARPADRPLHGPHDISVKRGMGGWG